jgi:hypothetical protein
MELHVLPVISTNHLTQEVAERLTNDGNNNPWCVCASWENGFFLHLDELEGAESEEEPAPQCLFDIRDWLRAKNLVCTDGDQKFRGDWVRLDSDAEPQDDLPSYDW